MGWCAIARLERGKFAWPQVGDTPGKIMLSHAELALLLGGIDLSQNTAPALVSRSNSGGAFHSFAVVLGCDRDRVLLLRNHREFFTHGFLARRFKPD
jgi:hypothetical protein